MKYIMIALLLFAMPFVAADNSTSLCSDGDNAAGTSKINDHVLATQATVEYGITDKEDTCVTGPEGVSTSSGQYLREYFCKDDRRDYDDIDCVKHGFTGCEAGKCIGKAVSNGSSGDLSDPIDACGNKILEKDKGETCDPPNDVCFGEGGAYGQCDDSCQCILAAKFRDQCGNGIIESSESCEADDDCSEGTCQSCQCVTESEETTEEESEETSEAEESETTKEDEETIEIPEVTPVEIIDDNLTDTPGIKTTSAITKFFTGVWDWIVGLFS